MNKPTSRRAIGEYTLLPALIILLFLVGFLPAEDKYVPYRLAAGGAKNARLYGFVGQKEKILHTIKTITENTQILLVYIDEETGEPINSRPIMFSEFSTSTQNLIRSRNFARRAAIARAEKLKDLMNESAIEAAEILIQGYDQFCEGDNAPKPVVKDEFKKTIERSFTRMNAGDKREPLVQYTYALIRAQLEPEREISHRQLESLVRNYPNYWLARRAFVASVTREVSYLRGASELKRFHTTLRDALALPDQPDEQVENLLSEYYWIIDTAAVFEMKAKTKKTADEILDDPDALKIIQVVEQRVQAAIDKQRERARLKAIEEEKRIQSLIAQATPIFQQAEQQYNNAWDRNFTRYQTSVRNHQQATFSSQRFRLEYQRCANDTDRVANQLRAAQTRRSNLGADAGRELKDLLDDEVNQLRGEQRGAENLERQARGISFQADVFRARAFQQLRNDGFQLQQLLMQARGFLFSFAREYFDAINNDPELAGKYKVLETTVAGMREQLFALAMQKFGKPNAKLVLKQESQQVVSLFQFSPHDALSELKKQINKAAQN